MRPDELTDSTTSVSSEALARATWPTNAATQPPKTRPPNIHSSPTTPSKPVMDNVTAKALSSDNGRSFKTENDGRGHAVGIDGREQRQAEAGAAQHRGQLKGTGRGVQLT